MKNRIDVIFKDGDTKSFLNGYLNDFTCSENTENSELSMQPGVCEQYVELSLYDRDYYIHNRAKQLGKTFEATIKVYSIDNSNTEKLLGTYYSSEWQVDADNDIVKVKGRDETYILDSVSVEPLGRDGDKTLHQLLLLLFENMHDYQWTYADTETQDRCSNIVVKDCWFDTSSLLTLLNKVCYLGLLRIFYFNGLFYVGRCL